MDYTTPIENLNELEPIAPEDLEVRAEGWYNVWRGKIHRWLESNTDETTARLVLAVPDMFALLAGLARDRRVPLMLKAQMLLVLTYVISPFDLMPEAALGVLGLTDDLTAMTLLLLFIHGLEKIEAPVLHSHWRGEGDPIAAAQELQQMLESNKDKVLDSGIYQKLQARFGSARPSRALLRMPSLGKASPSPGL